ncbi:hypothetical protein BLX88_06075 [Bacillus obstructivus]|uniref:hypothetical protein n=1 Tax=Heyndrickxia oleronia TaxID=38875 RepID=UPI0009034E3A|nr:hypothetical protein BLX88_06075 [Bacillus obstructivus]
MYTVQQMQALDYLLKRILLESNYPFYEKNLKLVISYNNKLWYGDFVQMDGVFTFQYFIDDIGDIEKVRFSPNYDNSALFKSIWDSYQETISRNNLFKKINDPTMLFNSLLRILNYADINDEFSPFYPYLLNAKTLKGSLELPLINLEDTDIELVSIIEVID